MGAMALLASAPILAAPLGNGTLRALQPLGGTVLQSSGNDDDLYGHYDAYDDYDGRHDRHNNDDDERPICIAGRAVMSFFMLGYDKSGTTSIAQSLKAAGLETAAAGNRCNVNDDCFGCTQVNNNLCDKEIWSFGSWCAEDGRTECPLSLTADEANKWAEAAQFKYRCEEAAPRTTTLADFTTMNVLYFGLPALLGSLYGARAPSLSFVVVLREPMHRLQSHFYYNRPASAADDVRFGEWLNSTFRSQMMSRSYSSVLADRQAVSQSDDLSPFYHSMYSLSFASWLGPRTPSSGGGFAPSQIAVLPMGWAMEDQSRTVAFLKERFPAARLDPSLVEGPTPTENDASGDSAHPSLEDDVHISTCQWMMGSFFDPDLARLSLLLVASGGDGTVGGYDGTVDATRTQAVHSTAQASASRRGIAAASVALATLPAEGGDQEQMSGHIAKAQRMFDYFTQAFGEQSCMRQDGSSA